MDDFLNVLKRDPQVQSKIREFLDKYNRLPYIYQSKIGYESFIQNVTLKEMINLMATTIVDINIEMKMQVSRIKYLESRLLRLFFDTI